MSLLHSVGCTHCHTEWNTWQKNAPTVGSECYECKKGRIVPIVTERERRECEISENSADNQQCYDITLVCHWCSKGGWPERRSPGTWKHPVTQNPLYDSGHARSMKCDAEALWEDRYVKQHPAASKSKP